MKRTETVGVIDGRAVTATWDVTPRPGRIVLDLGHGLTVVEREAPSRPGAAWVAPYAGNCAQHGHVTSRATIGQARDELRAHIAAEHRTWDAGRRAQGFRSQAHLDAFYAHTDHVRDCAECGTPGPTAWLEGDASWQPTTRECQTGQALFRASWAENFPTQAQQAAQSRDRLARYARGQVGYRLQG